MSMPPAGFEPTIPASYRAATGTGHICVCLRERDGRACSAYGEGRGVYRVLVGKPEGKRPLGRPKRRLEDNIKMDLQEVGYGGMDWIELAEDRDR